MHILWKVASSYASQAEIVKSCRICWGCRLNISRVIRTLEHKRYTLRTTDQGVFWLPRSLPDGSEQCFSASRLGIAPLRRKDHSLHRNTLRVAGKPQGCSESC